MQTANVSIVYLLGHWCDVTLGAKDGFSTPQLYHKLLKIAGCSAAVLRYAHGHLHENRVWQRSDESGEAVGYIGTFCSRSALSISERCAPTSLTAPLPTPTLNMCN